MNGIEGCFFGGGMAAVSALLIYEASRLVQRPSLPPDPGFSPGAKAAAESDGVIVTGMTQEEALKTLGENIARRNLKLRHPNH